MSNTQNPTTTIARGGKRLTIEVQPGFTVEQIIALLNGHSARVAHNQIVAYAEPPAEGYTVLASVLSQTSGVEMGQWAKLGEETKTCGGKCSGCGCSCNCTPETCCKK
jgi:hypothetical protein